MAAKIVVGAVVFVKATFVYIPGKNNAWSKSNYVKN